MLGARGKKVLVLHRIVKNDRMAAVGYLWSFAALRLSTGARDTTIGAALPVTDMPPLNANCSIASSVVSTCRAAKPDASVDRRC